MGINRLGGLAIALSATFIHATALAAPAAQVESARGVVMVHGANGTTRIAGTGAQLEAGERISTAGGGLAMLHFEDGTRMTLRPNTELVVAQYQFARGGQDNGMLLQLVRGGLRTVTGLISKGAPNAARIQTSTATIGIRGTDFDARVCERDCGAESATQSEPVRPNAPGASARVVTVEGDARVADGRGQVRRLIPGTSVYPGEVLETTVGASVALAFRDGTRMGVGPATRTRFDDFVFDEANAAEGRLLVSLLRGTMRVLGGRIPDAQSPNALVNTRSGTVRLRPGGLDLRCTGDCADEPAGDGLQVFAWLGSSSIATASPVATHVLQAGQGLAIARGATRSLSSMEGLPAPRPDAWQVPAQLFALEQVGDDEPGLFVHVRDGHIELASAGQSLHLGRGETGMARASGGTARPLNLPRFIQHDRVPVPGRATGPGALVMADASGAQMCR